MKAWLLHKSSDPGKEAHPLELTEIAKPVPGKNEILVSVSCCGICHTELDEIEGRTPPAVYPIIPGHQVIGRVEQNGINSSRFAPGDRVGVAWIYSACGECGQCLSGFENLCEKFRGTGRDVNGGYAEYMVVHEKFAYLIPDIFSDTEAAPLLCAGAIGYRSLRLTGLEDGQLLGLMGFGASAHLVIKMTSYKFPRVKVYVFARNTAEQKFALELGAVWAGNIDALSPQKLHSIIDTTPAWKPVVRSLENLRPGGRLVVNAIRKEAEDKHHLTELDYTRHLWMEKEIKSAANVTRNDVREFLSIAAEIPIRPVIEEYPFTQANKALTDLKQKNIRGAKVLVIGR